MTPSGQAGLAAAVLVLAVLTGARGQGLDEAAAPRALASNGAVVAMPEIAALDCDGKAQALRRIDLSNYRGPEPVPQGHPDRPIFDYEDRLARAYYTDCTLREHAFGDPGAAFSFGFDTQ